MKWFRRSTLASWLVKQHFGDLPATELITATRQFPVTARVDLQLALEDLFRAELKPSKFVGIHSDYGHDTITFANVVVDTGYSARVGPLQYDEIDIGELQPCRCLKMALWLSQDKDERFALLLTQATRYGRTDGVHLEIAVPPGEVGLQLSRRLLDHIERKVNQAASYRGKVLSLEQTDNYHGTVGAIKVHKLHPVARSEVILPEKTLRLLERNVMQFIDQRERCFHQGIDAPLRTIRNRGQQRQ
jgi:hypothetical protein